MQVGSGETLVVTSDKEVDMRQRQGRMLCVVLVLAAAWLLDVGKANAAAHKKKDHPKISTASQCTCRACELDRAGHPECVSKHAVPSNSPRYAGYYVGGATPFWRRGDGRRLDEGTWGWDYWGGGLLKRHVSLNWLHGRDARRRYGGYQTDGPKLVEKLHALHEGHGE
jgi:hypothetical protein